MSMGASLVLGLAILAAVYAVFSYNALIRLKHEVSRAWANIDVLLKQRHDELPKLVEVCKQYRQFEQETLERVIAARARVAQASAAGDLPALGTAESVLRGQLGRIFAVAEAYPELRSNEHFMQLQTRITALENSIADRREGYNAAANVFNIRIEQLPDTIIARLFAFRAVTLLEFASAEKADPDMRQLFAR